MAVVNARARHALFGLGRALGQLLKVNDIWLKVVGVVSSPSADASMPAAPSANPSGGEVFIPVTTALRKFERQPMRSALGQIVARLRPTASPSQTAQALDRLRTRLHGGANDYEVIVPDALLQQS